MRKYNLIIFLCCVHYLCYSQQFIVSRSAEITFEFFSFARNDTIFDCIVYKDKRIDSIKYSAVKYIKNDYIFLDSSDVNYFKIVKKNGEFKKCESSTQFLIVKDIINAEYECCRDGLFTITYENGKTEVYYFKNLENSE